MSIDLWRFGVSAVHVHCTHGKACCVDNVVRLAHIPGVYLRCHISQNPLGSSGTARSVGVTLFMNFQDRNTSYRHYRRMPFYPIRPCTHEAKLLVSGAAALALIVQVKSLTNRSANCVANSESILMWQQSVPIFRNLLVLYVNWTIHVHVFWRKSSDIPCHALT